MFLVNEVKKWWNRRQVSKAQETINEVIQVSRATRRHLSHQIAHTPSSRHFRKPHVITCPEVAKWKAQNRAVRDVAKAQLDSVLAKR